MQSKIAVTVLALFCCMTALSEGLTADEQAVWDLEESYWQYVKSNDIPGYLTLWDDRFVGWPGFSKAPLEKDHIGDWIAPLHSDSALVYDYKLTRGAVRSYGDVVATHYLVEGFYRSSDTGEIVEERYT